MTGKNLNKGILDCKFLKEGTIVCQQAQNWGIFDSTWYEPRHIVQGYYWCKAKREHRVGRWENILPKNCINCQCRQWSNYTLTWARQSIEMDLGSDCRAQVVKHKVHKLPPKPASENQCKCNVKPSSNSRKLDVVLTQNISAPVRNLVHLIVSVRMT